LMDTHRWIRNFYQLVPVQRMWVGARTVDASD
jgi:hypothetical protein